MRPILMLLVICYLSGCRPMPDHSGKQVFRYNEPGGISNLDPAFARDQAHTWICNQLYNGLVQLDDELAIRPAIAHSWDILDSGKMYVFHLRQDVLFHDHSKFGGSPRRVHASDFVYSFNRLADEKLAAPGAWVFQFVDKSAGAWAFHAVDDSTFTIRLSKPFPPFLGILSMQYCSVLAREVVEHYGLDYRKHPIGTGPFHFQYWKEGNKLVLLKNEYYFESDGDHRLPCLDAVSVSFILDKQTAFLEFAKGKLDFLSGLDASYKDELLTPTGELNERYTDRVSLIRSPYLNTEYLGFLVDADLVKQSPLAVKEVRQAINLGFDRNKMMRYLRNNVGQPAGAGFVPPSLYRGAGGVSGYQYLPDSASALLAKAGFPGGQGLGKITLSTTASYLDLCEYIQHQLSEAGIQIDVEVNPPATLREIIAKSKTAFFRGSWIADYPDPENYLSLFLTKNHCPAGPNYTHFSSATFDALYDRALAETDDATRHALYLEMDRLIIAEAAVVPLFYDQVLRFTRKEVKGLGCNAMNMLDLKRVIKE